MKDNEALHSDGLASWMRREVQEVGVVTLYFLFCFGVMLLLKKLLLASYDIEVVVLSTAVVSALVVGKVVIVLDKTRAGTRFEAAHSLGFAVLYKTLIYMAATFVALSLEKVVHAYRETGLLGEALTEVWMQRDPHLIWAKVICVGLAFAGYHLYAGLDRRLGEGTLRRLVFSKK